MLPRSSWGTLLLAYRLVLHDGRGLFIRMMRWPFLAALAFYALQPAIAPDGTGAAAAGPALFMIGQIVLIGLLVPAFSGWLRWVVHPDQPLRYEWRRPEWVFLGRGLQLHIVQVLANGLLFLGLLGLAQLAGGIGLPGEQMLSSGGPGLVLAMVLGSLAAVWLNLYIQARYGLSLVAAAAGDPSDFSRAASVSAPRRGHMMLAILLLAPTALAVAVPFLAMGLFLAAVMFATAETEAFSVGSSLVLSVCVLPVAFVIYGAYASLFGIYYRWLPASAERVDERS